MEKLCFLVIHWFFYSGEEVEDWFFEKQGKEWRKTNGKRRMDGKSNHTSILQFVFNISSSVSSICTNHFTRNLVRL